MLVALVVVPDRVPGARRPAARCGRRSSSCRSSSASSVVFGFVSLLPERDIVSPGPDLRRHARDDLRRAGRPRRPLHLRAHASSATSSATSLLALGHRRPADLRSYLVFRPLVRDRAAPQRGGPRAAPRRSSARYGSDTLAYFALRDDKSYFFSSDGRGVHRLRLRAGLRDGRGRSDRPARVDRRRCSTSSSPSAPSAGWGVAFLAVREADARSTATAACTRSTSATRRSSTATASASTAPGMKTVRARPSTGSRNDHDFELMRETEASPELVDELNEISERWRGRRRERGFTMALSQDVEGDQPGDSCSPIARDDRGRVPVGLPAASSPATATTPATRST